MPVFRRNKSPLFDLVRGGSANGSASSPAAPVRPPIQVEPTAIPNRPRPTLSAHVPGDEVTTADRINALRAGNTNRPTGGLISLPLNSVYLSIAGVIALVILIWAGAYWLGGRAKEKELAPYISAGVQPGGNTVNPTPAPASNPQSEPTGTNRSVPPPRLSGSLIKNDAATQPTASPPLSLIHI